MPGRGRYEPGEDPAPRRARPYIHTAGRTHPDQALQMETLLSVPDRSRAPEAFVSAGHRSLWHLCATAGPLSLAETAAHLHLPLGVARVLATDLITSGRLVPHSTSSTATDRPSQTLLQRVLDGLHRL